MQGDFRSNSRRGGPGQRGVPMSTLTLIYWLASGFTLGLFIYLGYALLRPEKF